MRPVAGWTVQKTRSLTEKELQDQMIANGKRAWKSFVDPPKEGVGVLRKMTKRPLGLKQGN